MGRFIDFDAARAEQRREPVVVRLFGCDWQLYAAIPASVTLELVHRQETAGEDAELSTADLMSVAQKAIPPQVLCAWLEKGIDIEELATVIKAVMGAYSGTDEKDEDEGEAQAPAATQ